jgi:hypothetical protein
MNGIKSTKIPRPLKYPSVHLKCWVGIAGCKNTHHQAEDVASFTARQQKSTIHVIPEKTETTNPLKSTIHVIPKTETTNPLSAFDIAVRVLFLIEGWGLQNVKRFIIQ